MKYSDLLFTWFGDVTSISGDAQYARAVLEPLIREGASVKLEPANFGAQQADLSDWWHKKLQEHTRMQPGFVKINHCRPNQATPNVLGGPNILLTGWHTTKVPLQWVEPINKNFTELWTTTKTAVSKASIAASNITIPTNFIPVPVDLDTDGPIADLVDINDKTVVFGTTGLWDQRSNLADLVVAYLSEFSSKDNVALVIKTNAGDPNDPNKRAQVLKLLRELKSQVNSPDKAPIIVLQDIFTQNAMDSIIRRFDIYVSTERGSHTNITLGKCLAMGKPCIVTDTGVGREYKALLKEYKPLRGCQCMPEPVYSYPDSNPLDRWEKPCLDHFVSHMRDLYIHKVMGDATTKSIVHKAFKAYNSPDVVSERVADSIRKLTTIPVINFS